MSGQWHRSCLGKTSPVLFMILAVAVGCNPPPPAAPHRPSQEEEILRLHAIASNAKVRKNDPDRVIGALERLADLGDSGAIDDLAQFLTYRKVYPWEKDPTVKPSGGLTGPSTRYPAVGALMNIGKPSLPTLIKVIETHEPDSQETENAMEVVTYLSRDKRPEYVDCLNEAASKASSPQAAERLRKAAVALKESKR